MNVKHNIGWFALRRDWFAMSDAETAARHGKYVPGNTRDSRRPPPFWMVLNMHHDRCWCGKPKHMWCPNQRKYCCSDHRRWWWESINTIWITYRYHLVRAVGACEVCGTDFVPDPAPASRKDNMDVDHVEAIKLDGSMWEPTNHKVLCRDCHAIKTACDRRKIAARRRAEKQRGKTAGKTLLDYDDQ